MDLAPLLLPDRRMPDLPPQLTSALEDRYRVERRLGEGGMATVYLAEDLRHHRPVALKVLKPELAAMVGADRFLTEIRTTARLQHPHILPLHDSGEAEGLLFYVMPYVEGESLRDRLDRERQLPVEDAVRIARQLSEALDYAHRQGVVHRDIKPANVLLVDGNPVLADFGIALAVGAAGAGRLTETGLSLGTPHYMSPEQATGEGHVGPATDLYALGCVLFEMLAGAPPYVAGTAQGVLGKILTEPVPSATAERPSVPAHVDAVIRTALEKVPADRFRRGAEFVSALEDPAYRGRAQDRSASESRDTAAGSWVRTAAAMAATAVVVALAMSVIGDDSAGSEFQVVAVDVSDLGGGAQVRLSPDGRNLLARSEGRLWIRGLSDFTWRELPGTEGALTHGWAPDGTWITFTVGDEVRRVAPDGGPASTLFRLPDACSWPDICGSTWGWDGRIWAVTGFDDVLVAPQDGGPPEPLFQPAEGVHYHLPLPLPGGAALLGADDEVGGLRWELWDGEQVLPLEGIGFPAVYGDGRVYHQRGSEIWATPWSEDERTFSGPAVFVAPEALVLGAGEDGSILAQPIRPGPEPRRELVWVDRQGRETDSAIQPPSGSGRVDAVGLSRGGDVLWRDEDRLWYAGADGVGASPVPSVQDGEVGFGAWSPDAAVVFLDLDQFGRERHESPILRFDLRSRRVDPVVPRGKTPSVSFDGSALVFDVGDVGEGELRILDLATGQERPFTAGFAIEHSPALSPAGPWIAFVSQDRPGGDQDLWVARFPDGDAPVLIERGVTGRRPIWSRDGTRLYFVQDGTLHEVRLSPSGDGLRIDGRDYLFRLDGQGVGASSFVADSAGLRFLLGGLREGSGAGDRTLLLLQNWRPDR